MSIEFKKIFVKKAPAYADPKLARDVELARERAWHEAYLASRGIG